MKTTRNLILLLSGIMISVCLNAQDATPTKAKEQKIDEKSPAQTKTAAPTEQGKPAANTNRSKSAQPDEISIEEEGVSTKMMGPDDEDDHIQHEQGEADTDINAPRKKGDHHKNDKGNKPANKSEENKQKAYEKSGGKSNSTKQKEHPHKGNKGNE